VNIEVSCTPDNNSSRSFIGRMVNNTTNVPVPNVNIVEYIGAYAGGVSSGFTFPATISAPGTVFRLDLISKTGTFGAFAVDNCVFSAIRVG